MIVRLVSGPRTTYEHRDVLPGFRAGSPWIATRRIGQVNGFDGLTVSERSSVGLHDDFALVEA